MVYSHQPGGFQMQGLLLSNASNSFIWDYFEKRKVPFNMSIYALFTVKKILFYGIGPLSTSNYRESNMDERLSKVLYNTVLYATVQFCMVWCCTLMYFNILYGTIQYCTLICCRGFQWACIGFCLI